MDTASSEVVTNADLLDALRWLVFVGSLLFGAWLYSRLLRDYSRW
jgi:hypothetical protein